MDVIFVIAAAFAAGWFWNDTLRARENVLTRCRRLCEDLGVQLLDETVAMRRLGIGRSSTGRLAVKRSYQFEYSADGQDRWPGRAELLGRQLVDVQIDGPEGVTVLSSGNVVPLGTVRRRRLH